MRWFFLACALLCGSAHANMLQAIVGASATAAGDTVSFSCPGTGSPSSTITCTGTYTGTAPSTSSWTYSWNSTCTGSGSVTSVASVGGGSITGIVVPTPSGACTGTVTITTNIPTSNSSGSVAIGTSYVGPGDVKSGAIVWVGGRGYSAAVAATGTQKAYLIRRGTDNVECDVLVATDGTLGLTSSTCNSSTQGGLTWQAFAGTDTVQTGTIAGNTMSLPGVGGNAGDTVSGTGVTAGTIVTASLGGTAWSVYPSQTVASTSLTLTNVISVHKAYDQSGNSRDQSQATSALQPWLTAGFRTTGTCMFFPGGSGGLSGAIPSTSQPLTVSHVASREQNFGASTTAASPFLAGNDPYSGWDSANGAYLLYAGSSIAASATESALHAIQNDFADPSSYAYIDGSGSTPGATGSTGTGTSLGVGQAASGGFNLFGLVCEAGMWSGFSGADDAAMNTNQHGTNGWNF